MKSILITSSILILLTAALRPLLRGKIDPRWQYALWLVAALRLLVPVELAASSFSALALLDRAEEKTHLAQAIGEASVPIAPAPSYEDAYLLAVQEYQRGRLVITDIAKLTSDEEALLSARAHELQAKGPTVGQLAEQYARSLWLGGGLVMGLWFLLVNLRLRRKLRAALPVEADCPLPVYVTPELPSPCLCGVFRPAVYVTPAALADPDRMRHVLAHELTHYRHRDHWWAWVRCLCLCLYWFDPLVWWAAALSRQDCELACDEGAIRRLGEGERIPYGRTLVAMIAAGRNPLLQTATTMTGSKRRVRERIRLIARKPKTAAAAALALVLIVGCAVGCTFTGAPEDSPEPDPTPSLAPAPPRPTLDTLQERLMTVPEDIEGVTAQTEEGFLASYRLNMGGVEVPLGHVSRWNQVEFEDWLYSLDGAGRYTVFARDSEHYYAIGPAGDSTEYIHVIEDATVPYNAACRAVWDYGKQQVLDTEGVEAFNADELREREYLQADKRYTDVLYYPYRAVNGSMDVKWIFRLVQPAAQGSSGVWIPERVEYYDEAGPLLNIEHIKPDTGGLTLAEYAAQLQAQADAGDAGWALTPMGALSVFIPQLYGHDISDNSFLNMPDVIENTREGARPTQAQQIVQEVVDVLMGSPHIRIRLDIDSQGRGIGYGSYAVDPGQDYCGGLKILPTRFTWEEFDWGTTEEPRFPTPPQDSASLTLNNLPASLDAPYPDNFARFRLWDTGLAYVHDDVNGTHWYYARGAYSFDDEDLIPYGYLRSWYDALEISTMRPVPIPATGQSHEDIARAWAEGWEGAMTKTSPGSTLACSYVRIDNVKADCHSFLSEENMDEFARSRDRVGSDYGKTWFTFTYETVFVPANENASEALWAGNTWYYEGDDAPEGALIYMRVAYMDLTDEGWVCQGTGTGW